MMRISQRASKSCTECIRRKNRCNKQIPCDVCVRRDVAHLCKLESVYKSGESTPIPTEILLSIQDIYKQLENVQRRLDRLERPKIGAKRKRAEVNGRDDEGQSDAEPQDAATTLEFLALGIDRRLGSKKDDGRADLPRALNSPISHILTEPADRPFPDSVIDALLPETYVQSILRFAEDFGLWQHCCVVFSHLGNEVAQFWMEINEDSTWSKVEPTWVALLYILLGIAVHQMSESDAISCGLTDADRFVLPNAFISAAEDALYHGQFLSRPTIWTVQGVAMLTLCGHNVCESDLLSSLLAVGVKTAQTLKLHSLGGLSSRYEREKGMTPADVENLELGKRLWWALTQEDWFGIPFRGVWSIHPDHFDTPMPYNCHNADLRNGVYMNRPDSELTVAFKQRFSSLVSRIVQNVFHVLRHPSGHAPFQIAVQAEAEIQALLAHLPAHLLQPDPVLTPPWANTMRHYLFISASHKIIIIHRAALGHGGTKHERHRAEEACIRAAEAIVEELDRGGREEIAMQSLWTIPYHGLAAAVVLSLSMTATKDPAEMERRQRGVEKARKALERLSPTSRIARRGLQVIADLTQEVDTLLADRQAGASDTVSRVVNKIKLPVNEMREISQSSASPIDAFHPDFASPLFNFSGHLEDPSHLLLGLQSVPDVGRLFDRSLGSFDWT